MNNEMLRLSIGQAARQSVIEEYDLKRHCLPQHIQLIDDLLGLNNEM